MELSQDIALPDLRDDIQLNEAPTEPEGAPSWTLYDPAANKYYKIGWLEFECLTRFKKHQTVPALLQAVQKETSLDPDEETIKELIDFLIMHNLVYAGNDEAVNYFELRRMGTIQSWWAKLMHSYLFFTLPLFRPENFLKKTYPILSPFFNRYFMTVVFIVLGYGIFLSIQRFDEISNTFINYLTLEGVILFVGATIIVKIIHELGHAYTATKYGVPVTIIGVAFIVLYPILYTETTNAWKLKNRNSRLAIAASGMMAELTLSAVTLLLWHVLPPGMGQSLCFMIAIVSMLASLLVNLNPLMKFDGYYLFSDVVGIDNLQDRSFAYTRWRLRKWLWGWNSGRPELASAGKEKLLIYFGFAVWVYRFFLYLGISLLVYYLFFQPLGLILMIIELIFFIGMPIYREMKVWVEHFREIMGSIRGKISLLVYISLLTTVFVPIPHHIEIPTTLHAEKYTRYYPPIAAKIEEVKVSEGQQVEKGDVLFRLSSDNLNHNIAITYQRLKNLREIQQSSQATQELANKRSLITNEIDNTIKEIDGLEAILEKLTIKAGFSGAVKNINPSLKAEQWVDKRYLLALLTDDNTKVISGYIRETDVTKIVSKTTGKFYADYAPFETYDVRLNTIEAIGARTLFWPELSSAQGGPIPSEKSSDGIVRPLPRHTVYPINFTVDYHNNINTPPNFIARGTVVMTSDKESLAKPLIKKAMSLFIMDSGL